MRSGPRYRSPLAEALAARGQKACIGHCGRVLPLSAFPAKPTAYDGHEPRCADCLRARYAENIAAADRRRAGTEDASAGTLPVCDSCGHLNAASHGLTDPVRPGKLLWLCEPCYTAHGDALAQLTAADVVA